MVLKDESRDPAGFLISFIQLMTFAVCLSVDFLFFFSTADCLDENIKYPGSNIFDT